MKKITSFILSLIVVISSCFFISDNSVTAYAADEKWDLKASYEADGEFSVDTAEKSGNGKYSIKIKNNDYGVSRVEKTFKVKPNTTYRATVMAKCVDYKKSSKSNHDFSNFGAVLATAQSVPTGVGTTKNKWERLTYYFESGDKTKYTLALYNTGCKGTAYFSDFRLEEITKDSNEWNFCVVYVNSIKASIELNGKKKTYSQTFGKKDKDYCTETANKLYGYLNRLSDGKVGVKSIDFYECEETVTSLSKKSSGSYYVDCSDKVLKKRLDEIVANAEKTSGKRYDHIVVMGPIASDAGKDLHGVNIGATTSYDIPTCVINVQPSGFSETLIATLAHEICHTFEAVSKKIDPKNTVPFHAFYKGEEGKGYKYSELYNYGQYGLIGSGAWQSDYMRRATYDGKGVDEKAYLTSGNSKPTVIYGSTKKATYKKTDVGTLTISSISDKTYTGKAIKPSVTVKDGKTKLKKGTDYTVSYSCNTDIGIATVIIKGKGKYSGTVGQNFNIVPPKTDLTVTSSSGSYKLSWKASKGATGYEIYGSTDGKKFKLLKTVEAGKNSSLNTKISSKGKKYTFRIRAYTELYPQTFYSGYSYSEK